MERRDQPRNTFRLPRGVFAMATTPMLTSSSLLSQSLNRLAKLSPIVSILGLGLTILSQTGCSDDAFCFSCTQANGGSGGNGGAGGSTGGASGSNVGGVGPGGAGQAGTAGNTSCGDTQTDPQNCGACGHVCVALNATAECTAGVCVFTCFPGSSDLDNDLNESMSNGCECQQSNGGVETCDGLDNDCNGTIDDGFDTNTDPFNCGTCGTVCLVENGQSTCVNGECSLTGCAPGFVDDPETPGQDCGYVCQISNGGVEICDGLDNDCNKMIDDVDLSADANNCGECFNKCPSIANTEPACEAGECVQSQTCASGFYDTNNNIADGCEGSCLADCVIPNTVIICIDPNTMLPTCAGECKDGYHDVNNDLNLGPAGDGCEYQCDTTNNGVEICDNIDNDCDGQVDENVDKQTDVNNCGECGVKCADLIPNSVPQCVAGQCTFNGQCAAGFHDNDGDAANGCEYACTDSNGGVEICDLADNDCNGIIDDSPTDIGQSCGNSDVGACQLGVTVACVNGVLTCSGAINPSPEVCDAPKGTVNGDAYDNDCNGSFDVGCVYLTGDPARLDNNTTNASNIGQHSTGQLVGASAGDDFLLAYQDLRTGDSDLFIRISTDAGQSWGTQDIKLVNLINYEVEPDLFMRSGRAYMTWSRFDRDGSGNRHVRRIYVAAGNSPYASANWNAASGNVPNIDGNSDSTIDTNIDCYNPHGVVVKQAASGTGDTIAVVWSEITGTAVNPLRNIYLRYSTDGGATWLPNGAGLAGKRIQINQSAAGKGELPVVASDGNGMVYVAWRDRRSDSGGNSRQWVRFARVDLTDPVNSPPTMVSNETALQPDADETANTESIVMSASGNNVHVAWVDLRQQNGKNIKKIRVASSANRGVSWTQQAGVNDGVVVNVDGQFADASAPAIAARNDSVIVAWEDTRSGRSDIYVTNSTNAGQTWPTETSRADQGDGLGVSFSYAPVIQFGPSGTNTVFVAWQDLRFTGTSILANLSLDGGTTFISRAAAGADEGLPARLDSYTNGLGNAATSQAPVLLTKATGTTRASVVWLDYRTAAGADGSMGDVYVRSFGP